MSTKHKSSAAPLAKTFLILSLVIVPVSMKATGFKPNLSGLVDAWSQLAGVFSNGYQPRSTNELLALNQTDEDWRQDPASESGCTKGMLARAQEPGIEANWNIEQGEPQLQTNAHLRDCCHKATKQPVVQRQAPIALAQKVVLPKRETRIVAFDLQEMTQIDSASREETLQHFQKQFALPAVDLSYVMRSLPKEFKGFIKVKALNAPAAPTARRCNEIAPGNHSLVTELKRAALRAHEANIPTEGPFNSEL